MNDLMTVDNKVALFDKDGFEHMMRIANAMSQANLVPEHLQGKVADCLMVCQQAQRWEMDPFAVAQCTFVLSGKLGYEGKLVAAVINARGRLSERLSYAIEGDGDAMKVTVSACFELEEEARTVTATVGEAKTSNKKWQEMPDQMLCYYGARKWGRRHAPELMLGVMTEDEVEALPPRDITPKPVDLDEEGVTGAGEVEPGTTAGMVITEQKGVTTEEDDLVKPASTNKAPTKRKRVQVTFRGEVLYKTKFLAAAKELLSAVEDEDEFSDLQADLKAAIDSVDDDDQAASIRVELQPLIEAVQKDFEEGEDVKEDATPGQFKKPNPYSEPATLDELADDFDLAME